MAISMNQALTASLLGMKEKLHPGDKVGENTISNLLKTLRNNDLQLEPGRPGSSKDLIK